MSTFKVANNGISINTITPTANVALFNARKLKNINIGDMTNVPTNSVLLFNGSQWIPSSVPGNGYT
jgi:hypothetical protein